jgi:hypothetical protein
VLQKRELHVMKELNKKLTIENAIVTQADKGKTIVIMDSKVYSKKSTFLPYSQSSFLTSTQDSHLQTVTIPEAAYI